MRILNAKMDARAGGREVGRWEVGREGGGLYRVTSCQSPNRRGHQERSGVDAVGWVAFMYVPMYVTYLLTYLLVFA